MFDIENLKKFVQNHTHERDSPHGYANIEKVYNNSLEICTRIAKDSGKELHENIIKWVTIVAWLYNLVNYNRETRKYVQYFLQEMIPLYSVEVMKCIDCISFSREKREGKKYYEKILSSFCVSAQHCQRCRQTRVIRCCGIRKM